MDVYHNTFYNSNMSVKHHTGIQTVGPRNIQFRSLTEARWSYFFDEMGWNWEYEPFELSGYIPDFIINVKDTDDNKDGIHTCGYEQMLVEVKGDFNLKINDLEQYADKVIKSGWKGCFLIMGSQIYDSCELENEHAKDFWGDTHRRAILGLFYYYHDKNDRDKSSLTKTYLYLQPTDSDYIPIYIEEDVSWICTSYSYENGCQCIFKPKGYAEFANTVNSYNVIDEIYQKCKNKTQWKPHVHNNCINRSHSKFEKTEQIAKQMGEKKIKLTLKPINIENEDYCHICHRNGSCNCCYACQNTGRSYWSDGISGPCMECDRGGDINDPNNPIQCQDDM